ncbi:MAG: hypothetical protein AAF195_04660, partial [Pseudomonadota bacterium]
YELLKKYDIKIHKIALSLLDKDDVTYVDPDEMIVSVRNFIDTDIKIMPRESNESIKTIAVNKKAAWQEQIINLD